MNDQFTVFPLGLLSLIFIFILGVTALYILVLYVLDVTQSKHAIRRNYPVIGRFRYFFEHMGTFFRQYFFAMDREELPFDRALRSWVYRAAKNTSTSIAFGSTTDLNRPNTPVFLNSAYPVLESDAQPAKPPIIGEHCPHPYQPGSYFNISGMSYGALSKVAVESLARGSKLANCWLNTGEGGLSPYHLKGKGDIVFQIGTAYYGIRKPSGELDEQKLKQIARQDQVKMFEIKLSQGAKPGKGGILPAEKVTEEIAAIRGIPAHQTSYSPNRHPDIDSDEALLAFIANVKSITGKPVGIKFVLGDETWITQLCAKIAELKTDLQPDFITLDSADGGTGAAPQPLMDYVGLPIKISLPIVASTLKQFGLQNRIRLVVSGKLITPSSAAWALCEGADFITSARGFMFALGCIQAMQCDKNECPTGITTHNTKLQKGLNPDVKSVRVQHYHNNMVKSIEMIAHSCGHNSADGLSLQNVKLLNTVSK